MRLHIGGEARSEGWTVFNIQPGPHVDIVGNCADLSAISSGSVDEIYASHVIEHLGYREELPKAMREFFRVRRPGGFLKVSVPDLRTLCAQLFNPGLTAQHRFLIMRLIFGGQTDPHDYHKVGLTEEFLTSYLQVAGFEAITRIDGFGLFKDSSTLVTLNFPVSLNMQARKPMAA